MASRQLIDLLKKYEGLVDGDRTKPGYQPYVCPAGHLTIGWGHRIAGGETFRDGIDRAQCETLLQADADRALDTVRDTVDIPLNQNQLDALASLCFNIGAANFRSSTLVRKLAAGDSAGAANEFLRWDKAVDPGSGNRVVLAGLTARRSSERTLFLRPIPKPLNRSRTVVGSGLSIAGTAAAVAMDITNQLQPVSEQLAALGIQVTALKVALAFLALAGAGFAIYARLADRREFGH